MYMGALYTTKLLGVHDAVLLSKVVLMTGGLVRMIGHSAELMPPLLLDDTDQFVRLTSQCQLENTNRSGDRLHSGV
jgi:hypothetical protein